MKELAEKDRIIAQKNKEISDLENELSRVQRDLYDANYHLRQIDDNVPIRERYENFDPDYRFRRR
jgi:septal ring factor EnvC (AmiA/AmiB activator)